MRQAPRRASAALIRLFVWSTTEIPRDRTPIWSIPAFFVTLYFVILGSIAGPILFHIAGQAVNQTPGAGYLSLSQSILTEFSQPGIASAVAALILVQGAALLMSLYHFITNTFAKPIIRRHEARGVKQGLKQGIEQGREQGVKQGIEQGRAERDALWNEWNQRRLDAEAQDARFDEPPPS